MKSESDESGQKQRRDFYCLLSAARLMKVPVLRCTDFIYSVAG